MKIATTLLLLLTLTNLAHAQALNEPDLNNPPTATALLRDLASEDFSTRQRAQQTLDTISLPQLETLQRLIAEAADPEAKSRLIARADTLDEQRILNPPNVTLHVNDATLVELAAALSKATGIGFQATNPTGTPAADRYTLSIINRPFWEVVHTLCQQHAIWFTGSPTTGIRLIRDPAAWSRMIPTHPFVLTMDSASHPIPRGRRAAPGAPITLTAAFGIGFDPRIHLLAVNPPEFEPILDSASNPLTFVPPKTLISIDRFPVTMPTLNLTSPVPVANRIPTIKGKITVTLGIAEQKIELADPAANLDKILRIGHNTVQLRAFSITPPAGTSPTLNMQWTFTPDAPGTPLPEPPPGVRLPGRPAGQPLAYPVRITLLDAKGTPIWTSLHMTTQATIAARTNIEAPVRMILTSPTRQKEVTVPFEFTDLTINPPRR